MKRFSDICISLILLIVLSPVLLLAAIAIFLGERRNPIFVQLRVGKNGKEFKVYKFRTMFVDSSIGNLRAPAKGDKRVTKVGYVLRKTSIDELLQLINVLKGDMSIIGPRAVPSKELDLRLEKLVNQDPENEEKYKNYMKTRQKIRPGITGMAQAFGRSSLSTLDSIEYDVYYVENISMRLDIRIIFETIKTVLLQRGAN
ncbi:MAG: sugar transferase [Bacillota bacterium]